MGSACARGARVGDKLCPQIEHAPATPLEQAAWNAALPAGAWRHDWITEKDGEGKFLDRRHRQGLILTEALARAVPADDDEAARLTGLLIAIESGWLTGQLRGLRQDEEEGGS